MTISARLVRKPRRVYHCDGCGERIIGPHVYAYGHAEDHAIALARSVAWRLSHVYAYGHAEDHAPPFGIRLHIECCGTDAKILAAAKGAN